MKLAVRSGVGVVRIGRRKQLADKGQRPCVAAARLGAAGRVAADRERHAALCEVAGVGGVFGDSPAPIRHTPFGWTSRRHPLPSGPQRRSAPESRARSDARVNTGVTKGMIPPSRPRRVTSYTGRGAHPSRPIRADRDWRRARRPPLETATRRRRDWRLSVPVFRGLSSGISAPGGFYADMPFPRQTRVPPRYVTPPQRFPGTTRALTRVIQSRERLVPFATKTRSAGRKNAAPA